MTEKKENHGLSQRIAASAVTAVLIAALIYNGGNALGNALLNMQKEYRVELFNRAAEQRGIVARMISDEEIHGVTTKYIAALANAVVRFEFFPRGDDAEIFFNLISILPAEVTVDRFEFTGRNLSIYCTAQNQESLIGFSRSLANLGGFKDASLESYQKKDGTFIGTVTCIAA